MDAGITSFDLLAHFDRSTSQHTPGPVPVRGVRWVLHWAGALAVLFFSSCVLMQFAYCLGAEHALSRAARAGAFEATLPRASQASIVQSIERRLTDYTLPPGVLRIGVLQNGAPIGGAFCPREGEQLSVTVAMPSDIAIPQWLRRATFWDGGSQIEVRAERQMPGRRLAKMPIN
jgi:hypothetical protein